MLGHGVCNDPCSGLLDSPKERGKLSVMISVVDRWTLPKKGERCR